MVKDLSIDTAPHSAAREAAHVVVASQALAGWLYVSRLHLPVVPFRHD
jgi:hypothetical protein